MKKILKFSLITICICISSVIVAQISEQLTISPDRPGVGTPPSVIPKKYFQFETGFLYEKINYQDIKLNVTSYNQSLFRYGLFSFAELRFSDNFTKTIVHNPSQDSTILGFGPINIGTKISIYKGNKIIPKIALLLNFILPNTGKEQYRIPFIGPSAYLLFQNSLSDKLALGYNLGIEWHGDATSPSTFYALNLGYSFTDKFSGFIENYADLFSEGNIFYLDSGFAYLLTNKLQIDTYAGIDLKGASKDVQFNFGLSWLIL